MPSGHSLFPLLHLLPKTNFEFHLFPQERLISSHISFFLKLRRRSLFKGLECRRHIFYVFFFLVFSYTSWKVRISELVIYPKSQRCQVYLGSLVSLCSLMFFSFFMTFFCYFFTFLFAPSLRFVSNVPGYGSEPGT